MEQWRAIPGWQIYEASNLGNVRRTKTGRVMKHATRASGYKTLCLYADGKRKTHSVHRLIAAAHLPDWDPTLTVDHINSKERGDNRLVNLRMATQKQQAANRDHSNNGKGNSRPIQQLDMQGQLVAVFESTAAAGRALQAAQANIVNCANGKRGSAGGYQWVWVPHPDLPGEQWRQDAATQWWVSNMSRVRREMVGSRQVRPASEDHRRADFHLPAAERHPRQRRAGLLL